MSQTFPARALVLGTCLVAFGCSSATVERIRFGVVKVLHLPYLEIPRPAAVRELMTTRDWGNTQVAGRTRAEIVDQGVSGLERWGWGPSPRWERSSSASGDGRFLQFLHISDAQIRDTAILRRGDYVLWDLFLSSTLRLELIENLDSLLLSSILRGFRREVGRYTPEQRGATFAIHTGDLTDISLTTELLDAASAVNHACRGTAPGVELEPLPFLSAAGNHDGLTFGVLDDADTRTWELGVNRLEFHLASRYLFEDTWPSGVRVENEVVASLLENPDRRIEGADVFSSRAREERDDAARPALEDAPVALKGVVNTPNGEDAAVQPGYFSLEINGFQIIVLDTRASGTHRGELGIPQLGWLYHELAASLRARRPALVFAHHHPDDFAWRFWPVRHRSSSALKRMLASFPHVLGYFYGHAHRFEMSEADGVWYVQAPSLVDFPLGGLMVTIERADASPLYSVHVDHVKAGPDRTTSAGVTLDALQDEALVYAAYDAGALDAVGYGTGLPDRIGKKKGIGSQPAVRDYERRIAWPANPIPAGSVIDQDLVTEISVTRSRLLGERSGAWAESDPASTK